MKYCKGLCGRPLGLLQGDYCEECYEKLSLRKKFQESSKLNFYKENKIIPILKDRVL